MQTTNNQFTHSHKLVSSHAGEVTPKGLHIHHHRKITQLAAVWIACVFTIALSFSSLFSPTSSEYFGPDLARAASANTFVDFSTSIRSTPTHAFSSTISTYGQDGGSINSSAKQRTMLNNLDLDLYRIPLRWNGGSIVSSAGGHPSGSGDAWISNIRASGGEPMIVVGGDNDNDFTLSDAANLVSHFNGSPATKVSYWIIGNEPGNGGMSISTYCTLFNNTIDAMKAVDPSIKVGGPAWSYYDSGTLTSFLQCAGNKVDIIDYHHYAMGTSYLDNATALAQTVDWENEVTQIRQLITQYAPARAAQIEVQVGEYNWSWRTANGYPGWNGDDRFFQSVATVWGASVVGHIAKAGGRGHQYADQNGALGITFEKSSEATHFGKAIGDPMPIYYGMQMFSGGNLFRRFGSTIVQASTTLPTTEVFASTNQKNIILINKDPSATRTVTLGLTGATYGTADLWQTDKDAPFASPTKKATLTYSSGSVEFTIPPYSVSTLILTELTPPSSPAPVTSPTTSPNPSTTNQTTAANNTTTSTTVSTPAGESVAVAKKNDTVSGKTVLDAGLATDSKVQESVQKVEYYIDGKLVQTITQPPFQFDTTKTSNGNHTLTEKIYYKDGKVKSASNTIKIDNKLTTGQRLTHITTYYVLPIFGIAAGTTGIALGTLRYLRWRRIHHQLITPSGPSGGTTITPSA